LVRWLLGLLFVDSNVIFEICKNVDGESNNVNAAYFGCENKGPARIDTGVA